MSSRRRSAGVALALAAALVALIPLGRLERARAGDEARAGIAATRSLIGPDFLSIPPERYYTSGSLVCLLYSLAGRTYSVSLCFDRAGRLVEATDARAGEPSFWSIRADPSLATVRMSHAGSDRVLAFMKNREAVLRITTWGRQAFRTCYSAALAIDAWVANDSRHRRAFGWLRLASGARDAERRCIRATYDLGRAQAAYGNARAPGLRDAVGSGTDELRVLTAELGSLAEKIVRSPSSEATVVAGAAYRAAFAGSATRLRIAYDGLRRAGRAVRIDPGASLEAGG